MSKKLIMNFVFLLFYSVVFSQVITGKVYDIKTNETLPGAAVYIDGTTLGTSTDSHGYFELELKESQNAIVVVSFIGYSTKFFQASEFKQMKDIYLEESSNQLNEINLDLDIWSREKKLRIFKSEFLGKTLSSKDCRILNEKDISLYYNTSLNTLTAFADQPIIIKNKYLGYKIIYNIVDFEVTFENTLSGLRLTQKVYTAGWSFFSELHKKTKKKIIANRENEYQGSLLHFMKSLANKQLTENKFGIYHKKFPIHPYKFFEISKENQQTKVTMTIDKLTVLYDMFEQSLIQTSSKKDTIFYIDKTGNHSPTEQLLFGGVFGKKRISSMLPLNYLPFN